MSSSDVKTMGRMLRQIQDPATKRLLERMMGNIDVLASRVNSLENPDITGWLDAELENGWVQFSDSYNLPQYYKDKFGIVRIRGLIKSGTVTAGTVLFTLPEGYRPERICILDAVSNSAQARFDVQPDGGVVIRVGSAVSFSFDNAEFQAYR